MDKETKTGLKNLNTKLDSLVKFLHKEMPIKDDLDKLATRDELGNTKNEILTSIDGLAKQILTYHQEMLVLTRRIDRIESWMKKVEAKMGIKIDW